MQSVFQAALRSWSIPPIATFALLLTALVYLRGWINLRYAGSVALPPWRAASFLAGLLSLWIALASPLDTFSGFVLTAHMLQHMLLMMVAPPLILLGAPLIPIVRGLPRFAAREFAGPFLNWPLANRIGTALTNPIVALILMGLVMFAWHTPKLYELALGSSSWHEVEHACFFLTSIIFWWPVVQPWPSRAQWPRWAMVPYLFVGDLQNTILSAILVFSDRVLYPSYAVMPSPVRPHRREPTKPRQAPSCGSWEGSHTCFRRSSSPCIVYQARGTAGSLRLARRRIDEGDLCVANFGARRFTSSSIQRQNRGGGLVCHSVRRHGIVLFILDRDLV